MMILGIFLAIAQVAAMGAPSPQAPSSPAPLKQIGHVHASLLCTALRTNIFQSVAGLRANDGIVDEGAEMLTQTASDSHSAVSAEEAGHLPGDDPVGASVESAGAMGGAGAGSEMDGYLLGILTHQLAQNLDRVEALLDDPHAFPSNPSTDDQKALAAAKARLEAVAARQRASLNILSANFEINSANDLHSYQDIRKEYSTSKATPAFTPISMADRLATSKNVTQQAEMDVAPVVLPIVSACR